MIESPDLAVIGGGPAGLFAALTAARAGLSVEVLDNNPQPGGQYFRHHPEGILALPGERVGLSDVRQMLADQCVKIRTGVTVWDLQADWHENRFHLFTEDEGRKNCSLHTRSVVVAVGAYERILPFEGWTIPGVMTTGAAQLMSAAHGILKNKNVVVYGTGPLLWPAVEHLAAAGAQVMGMLEANPFPRQGWRALPYAWQQRARLQEGWSYLQTFRRHKIPVYWQARVRSAAGNDALTSITFTHAGAPQPQSLATDYLFTGFGLLPAAQLLQAAGIRMVTDPRQPHPIPARDEGLQTSLPGLYAVGDGVFMMGKEAAALEGMLAGYHAACRLGAPVPAAEFEDVRHALDAQQRFTRLLAELFPFPIDALLAAADSTVLCRCEQITLGEIRAWIASGVADADNLKALTRIGMGRCQGRFCKTNLSALIRGLNGGEFQSGQELAARPPVFPVLLETLVQDEVKNDA